MGGGRRGIVVTAFALALAACGTVLDLGAIDPGANDGGLSEATTGDEGTTPIPEPLPTTPDSGQHDAEAGPPQPPVPPIDAGPDADAGSDSCVTCCNPDPIATTCAALTACSMAVNNCGQLVKCEICVAPQHCIVENGGTESCGCIPKTAEQACPRKQCRGDVSDGCGGMVTCFRDCQLTANCVCGGTCGALSVDCACLLPSVCQ